MFAAAIERAKQVDFVYAQTKKPIGKLHGLPVSVKDHYDVKGVDTTIGFVSWANDVATENSAVVERLTRAGGIVICKSNIPQVRRNGWFALFKLVAHTLLQSMLAWESNNPLFGWTSSPYNYGLTPGGSSGGEGTLIALKGAALGCGSDIGGSIRVPSNFSGIFGIKPSSERVPAVGAPAPDEGQHAIPGVFGPMANSVEGLKLWLSVVVGEGENHTANFDDRGFRISRVGHFSKANPRPTFIPTHSECHSTSNAPLHPAQNPQNRPYAGQRHQHQGHSRCSSRGA